MTAAALTHAVPDYEGKLYAATQTMDEARHVEAYEMYIRKIAIVYPISPWLKGVIDDTLLADHWVKIAIGMNMVVEGLALAVEPMITLGGIDYDTWDDDWTVVTKDKSWVAQFEHTIFIGEDGPEVMTRLPD